MTLHRNMKTITGFDQHYKLYFFTQSERSFAVIILVFGLLVLALVGRRLVIFT